MPENRIRRNYRFLTPWFFAGERRHQLPVSDASAVDLFFAVIAKENAGISRRQKPVVKMAKKESPRRHASHKGEASESGSWQSRESSANYFNSGDLPADLRLP
jgi:hypothetical protein